MQRMKNENLDHKIFENLNGNLNENQTERYNQNPNRLIQDIKEELYHQTLTSDVSEFSPKKVEYLVGLLDMEEATDEQEINKAQEKFEEFFQHMVRRKIQLNRMRKYRKQLAGACVVLVILFITADVTTKAVMDESLFHMVGRWKDQIAIRPAKENIEIEKNNFQERNEQIFKSNEEFAEDFGDDFLVCSWVPEGMQLHCIYKRDAEDFPEILWEYFDNREDEKKIEIIMYRTTDNDTAGIASHSGDNIFQEKNINGRKILYYKTEEGNLAGFEYHGWCYMIDGLVDNEVLDLVIKGMVDYETFK